MTTPIPALNPTSTGSEMKFATKPSRRIQATTRIAPTINVSVAAARRSAAGIGRRDGLGELGPGQDGERRGGADAQHARRAERGVDEHRQERRVEADLDRQPGNRGVGHRLGDDHGRGGQAGDDVGPQPGR